MANQKNMKIGIDARRILNPERDSSVGVGHYTYQLIRNLLKIDRENEYVLFFDYRVREKDVKKFSLPNVQVRYFPWSDYRKYLPLAYGEILGLGTITKDRLDVLHATSPDARVPHGYKGKVLCTFQDLSVYKYPMLFNKMERLKLRYNRSAMVSRADKIIAVSKTTEGDLMEIFNGEILSDKISVVPNGLDERFFEDGKMDRRQAMDSVKKDFGIAKNYMLFVGTLEPIKNVTRLLEAFKLFVEKTKDSGGKFDLDLVLVGKRGWLWEQYYQQAKDLGIHGRVKFLGYVGGKDLGNLLRASTLFVLPSLYEGFGTTALEAMACGTSVIVSDIPAMRELAGESVSYVNPFDIRGMADKMEEVVGNEELEEKGRERLKRAEQFSWEKCAKQTLEIYKEIAKK